MKKKVLITLLAIVLVSGVASAYFYLGKTTKELPPSTENQTSTDYGPPTEEEKEAADEQKKEVEKAQNEQQTTQPSNNFISATVIITDASQYDDVIEVRAFIPDHYQDGTCTITFTHGSNAVIKKTPAYRDASTTICTNPLIKRVEFPVAGSWQVVVSYSAQNGAGKSETKTIEIK